MRRYWGTFALLALAALLSLYFVFIETPRERARVDQQDREGRVLSLAEDEVTKLEIETPSNRLVLERSQGEAWRVSSPVSADADEGAVRRLLSQLTSLSVVRAIEDGGDPVALGLDPPALRVIVSRADGRAEVAFGGENPLGSGVYVRRDDGKVFLTATTAKTTFEVSGDDVRRKEFVDFKPEAVTDVTITHRGRAVRLHHEGGEWRMVEPSRMADPETVSSLLGRLRSLRATGFVDTVEEQSALRLKRTPRTAFEISAGADVVKVAFFDAADGSLYARASGDTLYRLKESVVNALPLDASSLRDLRVVRATVDDVQTVEVERGEDRYRATRSEGGWEFEGRPLADEGTRDVESMVRALTTLRGDSVAAEKPTTLPADTFASPAVRVVLRGADDRSLATVTISEAPGERRYAFSESSGPVFFIAPTVVDRIPSKSALESRLAPAS